MEGDQEKLKEIKENLTTEKQLEVMSPSDIPSEQKQGWVNFFAECINGVLNQNTPLKGVRQAL